ncbi:MAG: CAAX prenyl protease-related protein [Nitrospirales bacterium]|nr:CAAX prenyl protease-related protein [Nitrospirales bacterium]
MVVRILPFAVYLSFLAVTQVISWIASSGTQPDWTVHLDVWLYPIKTAAVLGLLLYFWPQYRELKDTVVKGASEAVLAVTVGLLVYLAWVRMDWSWAMQGDGTAAGYDPFRAGTGIGIVLASVRIFGATVVVPIMEELFWRSFLIRYLISSKFESVGLGTFTAFSFVATVVLFGLEHELWLAGMMAGMAYTGLLYYTKRLWPCILAHAVTNFALGIHVLVTGEWRWW